MQVAKHYLFHDGGFTRRNQSIDLLYIELFLDVVKQNLLLLLLLFLLFFYLAFLSQIFTIHRTAGEGGGCFLISFLPLPPTLQTLSH